MPPTFNTDGFGEFGEFTQKNRGNLLDGIIPILLPTYRTEKRYL